MAAWLKRISKEEANAIRAEVDAFLKTMPAKGMRARLSRQAGIHNSAITTLLGGGGLAPRAVPKLREAIIHIRSHPDEPSQMGLRVLQRRKEQAALKVRLKAALEAEGLRASAAAKFVGCNPGTLHNFMHKDATFVPKMRAKVEKWLDSLPNGAAKPKGRHVSHQLTIPAVHNHDRVAVVAARLRDLEAPEVDTPDVRHIVDAFLRTTGAQAIEAMLLLAKAIKKEGE